MRSSKYHDKAVDALYVSDNGYMVTASTGSRFIKIWRVDRPTSDHLKTEVTELQILRDHQEPLVDLRVCDNRILSLSGGSQGLVCAHDFPK